MLMVRNWCSTRTKVTRYLEQKKVLRVTWTTCFTLHMVVDVASTMLLVQGKQLSILNAAVVVQCHGQSITTNF